VPGRSVGIHPAALDEANAAAEWYGNRSRGAADAFLSELERTIDLISQHPEQYQSHELGTRRAMLHKFPYLIVFREGTGGIEIIAVAHARRKPGYWRDRDQ
jgi:plasmid stabilization system protein ParE